MNLENFKPSSWAVQGPALQEAFGIYLEGDRFLDKSRANDSVAPILAANNGIPQMLTTFIDPQLIDILIAPLNAAKIYGETRKGGWLDSDMKFVTIEPMGTVAAYGDYNNSGAASVNVNFPNRQQFVIQTIVQYGDMEIGKAGLANVDLPARVRLAAALSLNIWQNNDYFYGQAFLQNYGALNDPNLLPAITPTTKAATGTSWDNATAKEIFTDIKNLFKQLVKQAQGNVNLDSSSAYQSPIKLALSPTAQANLIEPNDFGISAMDYIKKAFPNLVHESAPQFSTDGGELVQMFIENYQGVDTFTCAFSEKLRSHGVVRLTSHSEEKLTQGGWGTILTRPIMVAQMLGV